MRCSLVVPIYNDGYMAEAFCAEVEKSVIPVVGTCEVVFVNDGSPNDSQAHLRAVAERFPWVTIVELSRNFGQHAAVLCGYRHASGQYVGMINVDMQDPPAQVPVLIESLEQAQADIVIGMRQNRKDPLFAKATSLGFNWVMNALTGSHTPLNMAALRIMNRQFLDAFLEFGERSPYIPGLENWLGFRKIYVCIPHQARQQGKSSYTLRSRVRLAYNSILSFSDYPLKLMTSIGLGTVALGLLWGAYAIWVRLTNPTAASGFASLLSAIIVFGGLNLAGLGIASLYIGRILSEVQRRPAFVIRSLITGRPEAAGAAANPHLNRVTNESVYIS